MVRDRSQDIMKVGEGESPPPPPEINKEEKVYTPSVASYFSHARQAKTGFFIYICICLHLTCSTSNISTFLQWRVYEGKNI